MSTMRPARLLVGSICAAWSAAAALADLPATFDLRDVDGADYVTGVRSQQGGTCWTHGVMAAMEGNLTMTGVWAAEGESGEANLAEYHLDWWNGFNDYRNHDIDPPYGEGLPVHYGGDYLVAAAYLSRGDGAVRDVDAPLYSHPAIFYRPHYHYYYPRKIIWLTAGANLENIDAIKSAVMEHGVVGTCMYYSSQLIRAIEGRYVHYQPPHVDELPNHAIAIVGWDDDMATHAPQPGAWLCKNSWGSGWGHSGYFWISYYDKWACQEPFMGAVSFQDVERKQYDHFYYHDYHGWRDTLKTADTALNAFVAKGREVLRAINFYTAAENVTFTATIYDSFDGVAPAGELATQSGTLAGMGLHTIDLDTPVALPPGDDFYIELTLSNGGQPYDRTSDIPVLLGAPPQRVIVRSSAAPGESYYYDGDTSAWVDLTTLDDSANFCVKGLANTTAVGDLNCDGVVDTFDIDPFVAVLIDGQGYAAEFPRCDPALADINADGTVDVFDISPFVALLQDG